MWVIGTIGTTTTSSHYKSKANMDETLYNYGPLCRETSRFVNLRGKQPHEGWQIWMFPYTEGVIVLLYFCQCFIGYLPCGGKLGCSAGNNRVASRQLKFLPMFYRLSPLWGEIWLFGGEQYRCCSVGNNRVVSQQRKFWQNISIILLSHD